MSADWGDRQVYWATLAYARWWLAVDGPFLGAVRSGKGFNAPLMRRVAVRYNVNRGLLRPNARTNDQDPAATGLIRVLHEDAGGWPASLSAGAARCVAIAKAAQLEGWTNTLQVSAVSKFIWFLKPDSWTPFDRFAAAGMGVPASWDRQSQFGAFYRALEDGGFNNVVKRIKPLIVASGIPDLPASRIIDALLMARGGRGAANYEVDESRSFIGLLPSPFRDDLHRLAIELQAVIGNNVLPPLNFKRKKS